MIPVGIRREIDRGRFAKYVNKLSHTFESVYNKTIINGFNILRVIVDHWRVAQTLTSSSGAHLSRIH